MSMSERLACGTLGTPGGTRGSYAGTNPDNHQAILTGMDDFWQRRQVRLVAQQTSVGLSVTRLRAGASGIREAGD